MLRRRLLLVPVLALAVAVQTENEVKAMKDLLKRIVSAALTMVLGVGLGAGLRGHGHPEKHTGKVQVAGVFGPSFWFLRPNGEAFEMYFDNPPAVLRLGLSLDDITYTDDNADMRQLVKIKVPK
jgi:hypothetical protein